MAGRSSWHPEDIKAAIRKKGLTQSGLAAQNGYERTATSTVLRKPWPAVERIVAEAIGVPAHVIWPHRYQADGTPKSRKSRRPRKSRKQGRKNISGRRAGNVYRGGDA